MDFFLIWVFPALLLGGIGFVLLLSNIKHINRCKAVSSWSTTRGTIERARVESHLTRRRIAGSNASIRRVRYEPKLEYVYNVLGTPFRSSGYQNFAGIYSAGTEEEANRIIAAYPVGKEVAVSYDPNNPADAYLLPQTSTEKLIKNRTGQIIMLGIALIWVGIGAVLNIASILGANASDARIKKSAGLIPFTAQEINGKLDPLVEKYQLTCAAESAAGNKIVYVSRACRAAPGSDLTSFEVFGRKESPETVDCISAIFTPSDQQKAADFFSDAVSLVFEGDDLKSALAWITESVLKVAAGEGKSTGTIGGIDLALDNLGKTLRLNIGGIQ